MIKSKYEYFYTTSVASKTDTDDIKSLLDKIIEDNGLSSIEKKTIQAKLTEYNTLREKIENKNTHNTELKERYNITKKQLENILFNKFRPNRLNFNEKQQKFNLELNEFRDDLTGGKIKMTHYGSFDKKVCVSKWKLPDNVPSINNKSDPYFNVGTKCCIGGRDECIKQYKQNVNLYNDYKVVLKNNNNKQLELNKITDNIYIVNLNAQILNYECSTSKDPACNYYITPTLLCYKNPHINNVKVCFKLIEITDLIHLNQFIDNEKIEDDLFDYPLYLLIPLTEHYKAITIHSKNELDGERLSIQPLSKEMINQQIFYKK